MNFYNIRIVLIFCLLPLIGLSQLSFKHLSTQNFGVSILEDVRKVKTVLACDYVDELQTEILDTFICDPIDTSLFKFIPVIHAYIQIPNYMSLDSINQNSVLSEVLLYSIEKKKIIGSGQFGRNGDVYLSLSINMFNSRSRSIPIRDENRFSYVSENCYSEITKLLKKERLGKFVQINETGDLYFFSEHTSPKVICRQ